MSMCVAFPILLLLLNLFITLVVQEDVVRCRTVRAERDGLRWGVDSEVHLLTRNAGE